MEFKMQLDSSVKEIVRVGFIQFKDVLVSPKNAELIRETDALAEQLRKQYSSPADAIDKLNTTRSYYRAIGLDPTKTRPSSEALLRRILKGKSIYQVNSVVDLCNFFSLSFLLSIGLYDVEKIHGQVQLRLGNDGEGYPGIGKEYVNLSGRLAMVDETGPFGNPSADSDRTKITLETREVAFVIFAPVSYPSADLEDHIIFIEKKLIKYHECDVVSREVL